MDKNARPLWKEIPNGSRAMVADYRNSNLIREYVNNPLIEPLPPRYNRNEVIDLFAQYPELSEDDRKASADDRVQMVSRLSNDYYQPYGRVLDLYENLDHLLRQGYLSRNPLSARHQAQSAGLYEEVKQTIWQNTVSETTSTNKALPLIGVSGIGKTMAINKILGLYPQVIVHSSYKGSPLTFYQITWLRLECPFNSSIKALCKDFFATVDELIGIGCQRKYASQGKSTAEMVPGMATVVNQQKIGLLIIDEFQNLEGAKSGGDAQMLRFLKMLNNKVGVPIVAVGTPECEILFQESFQTLRRFSGFEYEPWEAFENDGTWGLLMEGMMQYQWTNGALKPTAEIGALLHDLSQGILDVAIKLFVQAQKKGH